MKLILITSAKSRYARYEFHKPGLVLIAILLFCLPVALGMLSYFLSYRIDDPKVSSAIAENWKDETQRNKQALIALKDSAQTEFQAYTLSLAEAQSRLIRLEALAQKLAKSSNLHKGEFDFNQRPAVGGLHDGNELDAFAKPEFASAMEDLLQQLDERETQLNVLESLLNNENLEKEVFLAGRPIKKGWMSSFFGKRLDPFSGKLAQHKGVDFAGKENAEIIAVASGVVTWSGDRYGYGLMVEIDHGGGFKTRYAHNKENVVKVGDIVRKGQTLARMGSTGRSTGPHTHFEVLKNNRQINPERYVYRESY